MILGTGHSQDRGPFISLDGDFGFSVIFTGFPATNHRQLWGFFSPSAGTGFSHQLPRCAHWWGCRYKHSKPQAKLGVFSLASSFPRTYSYSSHPGKQLPGHTDVCRGRSLSAAAVTTAQLIRELKEAALSRTVNICLGEGERGRWLPREISSATVVMPDTFQPEVCLCRAPL